MPLQRRLLQIMLILLGLAALAGVCTIFLPGTDFIGRTAGSLGLSGLAIAFAMIPCRRLDRQDDRLIAMVDLTAVVIAYCLGLAGIWVGLLTNDRYAAEFVGTAFLWAGCALVGTRCFAFSRKPIGHLAGLIGTSGAAVSFVLAFMTIWKSVLHLPMNEDEGAATSALLGGVSLALGASLVGYRQKRWLWPWVGVLASLVAIGLGIYGIWFHPDGHPTWFVQSLIFASAIGIANVLANLSLPSAQRWLIYATIGALAASAACVTYINIMSDGMHTEFPGVESAARVLAASSIVMVCGILAIGVLLRFNRRVLITEARSVADIHAVALTCPRCGKGQKTPVGESRCEECGVIFVIKVAEPHCAKCDYVLLDLHSNVCPECGEPIPGRAGTPIIPDDPERPAPARA